jgi:hypothetical protein
MESDTLKTAREKIAEIARSFAPLLTDPDLSEKDIDAAIEELRPLRMHIRAIDNGSAPGFRAYGTDSDE